MVPARTEGRTDVVSGAHSGVTRRGSREYRGAPGGSFWGHIGVRTDGVSGARGRAQGLGFWCTHRLPGRGFRGTRGGGCPDAVPASTPVQTPWPQDRPGHVEKREGLCHIRGWREHRVIT